MKKQKYIFFILLSTVFFGCVNKVQQSTGSLKFYDDQNRLLFTSSKIKEVILFRKQMLAEIILPESDSGKINDVTSKNKFLNIYIDDHFIGNITVLSPIDSNKIGIQLPTEADEKNLIGIAYEINSTVNVSDNE